MTCQQRTWPRPSTGRAGLAPLFQIKENSFKHTFEKISRIFQVSPLLFFADQFFLTFSLTAVHSKTIIVSNSI